MNNLKENEYPNANLENQKHGKKSYILCHIRKIDTLNKEIRDTSDEVKIQILNDELDIKELEIKTKKFIAEKRTDGVL